MITIDIIDVCALAIYFIAVAALILIRLHEPPHVTSAFERFGIWFFAACDFTFFALSLVLGLEAAKIAIFGALFLGALLYGLVDSYANYISKKHYISNKEQCKQ